MRISLAEAIRTRLVTDQTFIALSCSVWFLRAPAGVSRPYAIFSGPANNREETALETVEAGQSVLVTVQGTKLEQEVSVLIERAKVLLEDYRPTLADIDVLRAKVEADPVYVVEDDGAGDVFVGALEMVYYIAEEKGA